MNNQIFKIAITGHRPDKLGNDYDLVSPLVDRIRKNIVKILLEKKSLGYDLKLITGMALGIDTLFAKIAIAGNIPFIAAVPFKGQERLWPQKSQIRYLRMLELAEKVIYVSPGGYEANKMQIRNEWMVKECDLLIAVWNGTPGGTANCVRFAQQVDKPILYINPYRL